MAKLKGKAKAKARINARKAKQAFNNNNVKVGFVDQIMHNVDITQDPKVASELMIQKLFQSPNRMQVLRDTGEVSVNYTIQPNGAVVETPMQKGIDKGVKNLVVMDDDEAIEFGKRHGVLIVKDPARQSSKYISELDSEMQDILAQHGDLYIGKMYLGDMSGEYHGVAFSKEAA